MERAAFVALVRAVLTTKYRHLPNHVTVEDVQANTEWNRIAEKGTVEIDGVKRQIAMDRDSTSATRPYWFTVELTQKEAEAARRARGVRPPLPAMEMLTTPEENFGVRHDDRNEDFDAESTFTSPWPA